MKELNQANLLVGYWDEALQIDAMVDAADEVNLLDNQASEYKFDSAPSLGWVLPAILCLMHA